jgi:putative ABC transport system permease protein
MTLVIRSPRHAAALAAPVRDVVRTIDPAQPVTNVRLYEDIVRTSTGARRFAAWLLAVFAVTALTMAVVGLYGALGVAVGQRRREIGVRLALGANGTAIRRMVLGQGLRPVAAGLLGGLILAALVAGAVQSLLFEVSTRDPATFAAVGAVLLVCALSACLIPAWRAGSIDPAETLRADG